MKNKFSFFWTALILTFLCSCEGEPQTHTFGELVIYSFQAGMCRVYLIKHKNIGYLIDTGSPGQQNRILEKMHQAGVDSLAMIILTHGHFDHYGSARALRDSTGASIAIHRADAQYMAEGKTPLPRTKTWGILGKLFLPVAEMIYSPESTSADILLEDKQNLSTMGLNATIMHTPGHTPGSICIMLQDSLAFVGDLISARPTNHVQKYYAFDWEHVRKSFYRLKKSNPSIAFPGHGNHPLSKDDIQKLRPNY
ncbi:MAG: MBL fold metallo-hydrolase [Fibrobacterota bacterium]